MRSRINPMLMFAPILCLAIAGCGKSEEPTKPATPKPEAPKTPLIQKTEIADWCPEHTVPESICTRCNASLIPEFQKKNDWCKAHSLPDSQCFTCHPELEAKFKAMAPKTDR